MAGAPRAGMFGHRGPRTRRLLVFLRTRAQAPVERRTHLDRRRAAPLFRRQAVVFTDTADFTARTLADGILHFLMLLERAAEDVERAVLRCRGHVVKMEADSLLLRFPDVASACRGVAAIEACLARRNRRLPPNERLRFSYGIGYGDILDLDDDLFGLEVNLASKLGEDVARPGEALLTPSAAEAMRGGRRLVPHGRVRFGPFRLDVRRLPVRPPAR